MGYREHPAPLPLRGLVECVWSAAPPPVGQVRDVLPDGCMDLVWTGTALLVAGPDTAPHPAHRDLGAVAWGLRFAPGRLPTLLGVPAAALRDHRVALLDLHPALASRTVARLEQGDRVDAVLTRLVCALPGTVPEPAVAVVAAHLGAGASVADTADALGWTSRSLHRRCLAAFGYGPAVLRRVLRFRRAVDLLRTGTAPAAVAARAGYADQPHLSREVRALAGMAPGQLASGANRSTPVPSGSSTTA